MKYTGAIFLCILIALVATAGQKMKLEISGMHCEGCQAMITNAFEEIKGVKVISIDHATGKAIVEVDDGVKVTSEDFQKKLLEVGKYKATSVEVLKNN